MIITFASFFEDIKEMFFGGSYLRGIIIRLLIIGAFIAVCSSMLGVSLVLKRFSMIGDGLSHVAFGTGALAAMLKLNGISMLISIPITIFVAFILLRISEGSKVRGDAAIAIVSTTALALGSVFYMNSKGGNGAGDVCNALFGNFLDSIRTYETWTAIILSVVVITLYVLFYNKIFGITFDETFARATGVHSKIYTALIAVMTAVTIVIGMKIVGALLITCLIVFPPMASMRKIKSFRGVVICSAVISVVCSTVGIIISYTVNAGPGTMVVVLNTVAFIIFWFIGIAPTLPEKIKKIKRLLLKSKS